MHTPTPTHVAPMARLRALGRRAFTMLEMIGVVILIGVLVVVGYFGYQAIIEHVRHNAVDRLADQVARSVTGDSGATDQPTVGTIYTDAAVVSMLGSDLPSDVTLAGDVTAGLTVTRDGYGVAVFCDGQVGGVCAVGDAPSGGGPVALPADDRDGDGASDDDEIAAGLDPDDAYSWVALEGQTSAYGLTDGDWLANGDTDGDGISDRNEVAESNMRVDQMGMWPGPMDWRMADTDSDGVNDPDELSNMLVPSDPYSWRTSLGVTNGYGVTDGQHLAGTDTDGDGITDSDEAAKSDEMVGRGLWSVPLDWHVADTDGDGFDDLLEMDAMTDPTDPASHP